MSAKVIVMVTFAETTQVSPVELCEPPCPSATLSPGLRRKNQLWQNAVKHIIIQQELSAQVIDYPTDVCRLVAPTWNYCFLLFVRAWVAHSPLEQTLYPWRQRFYAFSMFCMCLYCTRVIFGLNPKLPIARNVSVYGFFICGLV